MFGVLFLHLLLDLDIAILMHTFESAFESLTETDIKVMFTWHWTVFWPAENLTGYFVYMEPFHCFLCSQRTLNSLVPKCLYDEGGSI